VNVKQFSLALGVVAITVGAIVWAELPRRASGKEHVILIKSKGQFVGRFTYWPTGRYLVSFSGPRDENSSTFSMTTLTGVVLRIPQGNGASVEIHADELIYHFGSE
jgi:hypothetical protein